MEELNLNSNPIKKLSPSIGKLEKLIVLGISYTQIEEIPSDIIQLTNLQQLNCFGAPLQEPKAIIANRGINVIRRYFKDLMNEGFNRDKHNDKGNDNQSEYSNKSKNSNKQ